MNIKLVRLLFGDDVIAEVTDETLNITLKNPMRVVVIPGAAGQSPNVGFAPWAPFSKETEIVLDKSNILAIMEPIDEFVQQYKMSFSPIVTPPQSKLILPRK
jgi:hypothetical protein